MTKVSVYDSKTRETLKINIGFDFRPFIFIFVSVIVAFITSILVFKGIINVTGGQIAPGIGDQFTAIIFGVIAVMGVAIVIMMVITQSNSKYFLYWLCLVKYPDLADDLKQYGIKGRNKKISNLIGQKLYDEFKRRWPSKPYDQDWIYNDVIFKKEYPHWLEKHGKDKLGTIADEVLYEDKTSIKIPPAVELDIPHPDDVRDVNFLESDLGLLLPSEEDEFEELQELLDNTVSKNKKSYMSKKDKLLRELDEYL